ncbi:RNA polymerase Rpb2, domain 6 [compost metagenome]
MREIDPTLLGQLATDPFFGTVSAARAAMYASHIGQAPIMEDNEPRRTMTGVEPHYADHTFDIRFPVDATILHVIRKYPPGTGMGADAIRHNPLTTIIYEDYYCPRKTIGVIQVPEYLSMHQDFGYPLVRNEQLWDRVVKEATIGKGEVLCHSSAVKGNGLYGTGISAEVVFLSVPGGIEDGFDYSNEFLERMAPTTYGKFVGSAGQKSILLNLYGDDKIYKPFPDVGEKVRADGIIMAMRDIDENLAPAEMTARALRTVDLAFDRCIYGKPRSTVKDVVVYRDSRVFPSNVPIGMDTQLNKYYQAGCRYYRQLMDIYDGLRKRRGKKLHITEELNQLLVEAQIYLPTPDNVRKLTRMHRLEVLDEYRVEITTENKMIPDMGFKATDCVGGKGVVCRTRPASEMPLTKHGVRADVVIYGGSTIRRSNFGRFYEQYYNAASRDLLFRIRAQCGFLPQVRPTKHQLQELGKNRELVQDVFHTLRRYFALWAPIHNELLEPDAANPTEYVLAVLEDGQHKNPGITVNIPVDNPVDILDTIRQIEASEFKPHYDTVTYTDNAGNVVETDCKVLCGALQMFLLEKIGEDWSGVASAKTQQFGLPAKMGSGDANRTPGRENPMRSAGESETRSYVATIGSWATNELLDQTNNPMSHRAVIRSILQANEPTNIDIAVPRDLVPYGGSRPVQLMNHLLECRGLRFIYTPDH